MSLLDWITAYREIHKAHVDQVSLNNLTNWELKEGKIARKDSGFFSILGIRSDEYPEGENEQPIIDQPEIGFLGFLICHGMDGTKILLQAKSEPGNIGITQIGPSVQATESNYNIKHGGKSQNFIEFFLNEKRPWRVSLKQSEQGNRFLNKMNLNMIVEVQENEVELTGDKYKWFTLEEITKHLNDDFLFNTDFKSVASHLLEFHIHRMEAGAQTHQIENVRNQLTKQREKNKSTIKQIPLHELKNWELDDKGLTPQKPHDFGVNFFNVKMEDREVLEWSQPLITKKTEETAVLMSTRIDGKYNFIFKESKEIGFKNHLQLGPTVQFDNEKELNGEWGDSTPLIKFKQSEEGGRFFQNISNYEIRFIDDASAYEHREGYYILNVPQICELLKIEGTFTNEARTLIASLLTLP